MSTLITGSLAFDTIMVFPDQFKKHILPEQIHILNVCFLVPEMRKEYGGTAGNIAYNMQLLGGDPLPMATVGVDFALYRKYLQELGINDEHIRLVDDTYTAQAYVTTDLDANQVIAFHPGAMNEAHQNKVNDASNVTLGIVSPDGRDAMIQHAEQFNELGIPFFFDPGQGLPMFDGDDLKRFIEQANFVIVNDYESAVVMENTGLDIAGITEQVEALIITRGGKGADIYTADKHWHIDTIEVSDIVDPTGCGDAFRAGLLHGINKGWDWQTCGQLGSVLGGLKIAQHGTQNHRPSKQDIAACYQKHFGKTIEL